MNKFECNYEHKEGSVITINRTGKKELIFSWKDLVEDAENIVFFGIHFVTSHLFDKKFKMKGRECYIFPHL